MADGNRRLLDCSNIAVGAARHLDHCVSPTQIFQFHALAREDFLRVDGRIAPAAGELVEADGPAAAVHELAGITSRSDMSQAFRDRQPMGDDIAEGDPRGKAVLEPGACRLQSARTEQQAQR